MIGHLEYEVIMLRATKRDYQTLPNTGSLPYADPRRVHRNALFESFLVHARLLDEFLNKTPESGVDDDVWASHYVAGWVGRSPLHEIRFDDWAYSTRQAVNKNLMHLSSVRLQEPQPWLLLRIESGLRAHLQAFVAHPDNRFRAHLDGLHRLLEGQTLAEDAGE
ncbi:hypothetical protein C7458_10231 [Williamsia muralis]|nr:hypothetical protein C7458_10231 [Williamsia marianensis]